MFAAYSRFEFALKEYGFLRANKDGIAHADWKDFSEQIDPEGIVERAAKDADVREMIANPPRVQIVRDKHLDWEERIPAPITKLDELLWAVKSVRNNLFHGGKRGDDPRDNSLCRASLIVLSLCLERHDGVRNIFEGKY